MGNYSFYFRGALISFRFNYSINFKGYHCVQTQAEHPWNVIAAWKINHLKKPA